MSNNKKVRISCCAGYVVQAVINNLLPLFFVLLQKNYKISYTKLGLLVLINFISQLAVDIASIPIIKAVGTKRAVLIAHLASVVGIGGLAILPYIMPTYLGLIICIVIYAVGSGLIEVLISPISDALPSDSKEGSMSFLHSFYCWGQVITILVTTILIKLFGGFWRLVPLFWVALPLVNFFSFLRLSVPEIENSQTKTTKNMLKNITFYVFLIMMLCAGASELAMAQWASTFAEAGLGIHKIVGDLFGPCLFAVFMGSGRALYSLYAKRVEPYKIMAFCGAFCVVCYITAAFSPSAAVSLAACSLCGLSVSIMWPFVLSMAAARFEHGGAFLFSTVAIAGDLGCCVGPWLLGIAADIGGFNMGFSVAAVFPLFMLVCAIYMYFNNKKEYKEYEA